MTFLELSDFDKQIRPDILAVITSDESSILDDAELTAISEMSSYLRVRYDVAQIFAETEGNRDKLIIMYLIDIMLYHIHSRINPQKIPELRGIRYDSAINWLKMVARGELSPDLPLAEGSNSSSLLYGSNKKRHLIF